ncbi:MAG: hypothetical protein B6U95_05690 [Thermofilum sp. ex4484_82]|nr:MAG: hypothetical protein B6U95_05690 [Thermofilum sp. ex4484_82]OYT37871.1 MAG: hypothetical protein B6U96_05685 [Archaeoglobales archaeon ex4484_92]
MWFNADRDVIGSWNIRLRGLKQIYVENSVPPESFPIKPVASIIESARDRYLFSGVLIVERCFDDIIAIFYRQL